MRFASKFVTYTLFSLSLLSINPLLSRDSERHNLEPDYSYFKLNALKATVDYFDALFLTKYAPIRWKQFYRNWDSNKQCKIANESFQSLSNIKFNHIKPILNRLFASTYDGHVGIYYTDNRTAKIPVNVDWLDGHIFVIGSELAGVKVGDELIRINDQPILDYISYALHGASWEQAPMAKPQYDIDRLFTRLANIDALPDDMDAPLKLTLLRQGKEVQAFAIWDLIEQQSTIGNLDFDCEKSNKLDPCLNPQVPSHFLAQHVVPKARQLHKISLMNTSGSISESDKDFSKSNFEKTHWCVREVAGKRVGYLRLPDFLDEGMIDIMDEALDSLMETSDALLIDLRDNGGGYDLLCFAALSRLCEQPLVNTLESSILSEETAYRSRCIADYYCGVLEAVQDNSQLHRVLGCDNYFGYYVDIETIKEWALHYKAIAEEWEKGNTCTRFIPTSGVNTIKPHPKHRYTKPLFVLINEKAGSNGDVFPAILKDNHRATLIGRTTAGLGGTFAKYRMPNFTGIDAFCLTESLVLRTNQYVIEDLGVSPDYEYKRTLEDAIKPHFELDWAMKFVSSQIK